MEGELPFLEALVDLIQLNPDVGRTSSPGGKFNEAQVSLEEISLLLFGLKIDQNVTQYVEHLWS